MTRQFRKYRELLTSGLLYDIFMPVSYAQSLEEAWEELDAQSGDRVLDSGSGTGKVIVYALNQLPTLAEFCFLDIQKKALESSKYRAEKCHVGGQVRFIEDDLTKLTKIPENSMGRVLCLFTIYVIEGEDNRLQAIKNLQKTLKPGGRAVFTVPSDSYNVTSIIKYDKQVSRKNSFFIRSYNNLILYPLLRKWLGNIEASIKNETYAAYNPEDFLVLLKAANFQKISVKKTYGGNAFHYICKK